MKIWKSNGKYTLIIDGDVIAVKDTVIECVEEYERYMYDKDTE